MLINTKLDFLKREVYNVDIQNVKCLAQFEQRKIQI